MGSEGGRNKTDFFDEVQVWSRIKHRILDKYLDIYLRKRGSSNPVIFFIDGFAGKGWYGSGEKVDPGSPILAARYAQSVIAGGKPYRMRCIFVEADSKRAQMLDSALSEFDPSIVKVIQGPFCEWVPSIIQIIEDHPALFFLDPFGVKGIELFDIQPLLDRPDTELIVRLDGDYLGRLGGFEDSDAPERESKLRRVSLVLGEDPNAVNDGWLAQWIRLSEPEAWVDWAIDQYARRLVEQSPYLKYALPYGIRESYRSRPKYHLIFATRNLGAVALMNDVVCIEDEHLFSTTEIVQKGQSSLFGDLRDQELEERLRSLMEEIYSYGIHHQAVTRDHLIEHFAADKFGLFMKKHYRKAIDELVKEGRARFGQGLSKDKSPIYFQ